ncbi:protein kinase [Trypanosoma theileri]|uniref:Protein kinase n=1 Tax=Trypanosoma theileri TaxID=67003 RepID=A0A1X0NVR3_9TRYP|nr:protein kinase [Trypanosoma theileri]ORC88563.1 protein kinase [Trypanosoma theileri]
MDTDRRKLAFEEVITRLRLLRSQLLEKKDSNIKHHEESCDFSKKQEDRKNELQMVSEGFPIPSTAALADENTSCNDDDVNGSFFSLLKVGSSSGSELEVNEMCQSSFELVCQNGSVIISHTDELLGIGAYSKVYHGSICFVTQSEEKRDVAVKVIPLKLYHLNEIDRWIRVLSFQESIVHPSFISSYYAGMPELENEEKYVKIYIALEKATGGTLDGFLKKNEKLSEDIIRNILSDVLCGLCYLHNTIVAVHNDVKPQNILLVMDKESNRVHYKLADFDAVFPALSNQTLTDPEASLSYKENKTMSDGNFCGTAIYMSPESCKGIPYLPSNDVWSIGIMTYQLSTGRLPWRQLELQVPSMILHGYREDTSNAFGPTLDEFEGETAHFYSDELKDMVKACLAKNVNERPTVEALLQYPFFSYQQDNS